MSGKWASFRRAKWLCPRAASEDERNEERDTPKVSVGGNDAVQTNENAPAHTQPAIDIVNDVPFKVIALSTRLAVVVACSCVAL